MASTNALRDSQDLSSESIEIEELEQFEEARQDFSRKASVLSQQQQQQSLELEPLPDSDQDLQDLLKEYSSSHSATTYTHTVPPSAVFVPLPGRYPKEVPLNDQQNLVKQKTKKPEAVEPPAAIATEDIHVPQHPAHPPPDFIKLSDSKSHKMGSSSSLSSSKTSKTKNAKKIKAADTALNGEPLSRSNSKKDVRFSRSALQFEYEQETDDEQPPVKDKSASGKTLKTDVSKSDVSVSTNKKTGNLKDGNQMQKATSVESKRLMTKSPDAGTPRSNYQSAQKLENNAVPYDPEPNSFDSIGATKRKSSATSIKTIPVENGTIVIQVPVSKHVIEGMKFDGTAENGEEFSHLRYTPITCDPDDFVSKNYSLRSNLFKRKTKIAIVITMYNEDDILFCKSFRAIMKNISYICSGKALWSENSWKEIVVVIVSDGRAKINQSVLNVMSIMGMYMDGLIKTSVNGDDVRAHMFEYTCQASVDNTLKRRGVHDSNEGITLVPCQTIFLLKEKNAKKINSHRWFFNGICEGLNPEVCILLDVGTKPTKESLFHLYNAFHFNENVGGACGEIAAELGKNFSNLLNPLVAVQNFEYKMSNILDKPLESVFGYISVLPGAFSAYRFEALKGNPLIQYFKGESPHGENAAEANMYLAEDRILCFELCVKQDRSWLLKYVKSARAETDVPTELHDLISQRRRWLNGSFFAAVHATMNWMRIFRSAHTSLRKWLLLVEFFYNFINLVFQWFNIGNFYLSFYFLFGVTNSSSGDQTIDPFYPHGQIVFDVINEVYVITLIAIFILSLGNRPQGSPRLYIIVSVIFAILMVLMLFMCVWTVRLSILSYLESNESFSQYVSNTPSFRDIIISMVTVYGVYVLSSLAHMDALHCVTCLTQYMFLLPTYVNVFMVYAFCNIHDVSWGTKGDNVPAPAGIVTTEKKQDGKTVAILEVPDEVEAIDGIWEEHKEKLDHNALLLSANRKNEAPAKPNAQTIHDDFFKQFRTKVVLAWIVSNIILVFVFTCSPVLNAMFPSNAYNSSVNPYLTFLFWSIACLSIVRFLASFIYMFGWWDEFLRDSGKRRPLDRFRKMIDRKVAVSPDDKV